MVSWSDFLVVVVLLPEGVELENRTHHFVRFVLFALPSGFMYLQREMEGECRFVRLSLCQVECGLKKVGKQLRP